LFYLGLYNFYRIVGYFLRLIVKMYYLRYKVQAFMPVLWICIVFDVPDPDPDADLDPDLTLSHSF